MWKKIEGKGGGRGKEREGRERKGEGERRREWFVSKVSLLHIPRQTRKQSYAASRRTLAQLRNYTPFSHTYMYVAFTLETLVI